MLHTSLVLLRSQQSRMLQAPLSFPQNRVPPRDFVFFWRYYVGLPPLIRPGRALAALPKLPTAPAAVTPPRAHTFTDLLPSAMCVGRQHQLAHATCTADPPLTELCVMRHERAQAQCTLDATGAHQIACSTPLLGAQRVGARLFQSGTLAGR